MFNDKLNKDHHEYKHSFYGNTDFGSTEKIKDTQMDSESYPTPAKAEQALLDMVSDQDSVPDRHYLETYRQTHHIVNGMWLRTYIIDIYAILNEHNEQVEEERKHPYLSPNVIVRDTQQYWRSHAES